MMSSTNSHELDFHIQAPSDNHEGFGVRIEENQERDFSPSIPESKYNYADCIILSNMNKDAYSKMSAASWQELVEYEFRVKNF